MDVTELQEIIIARERSLTMRNPYCKTVGKRKHILQSTYEKRKYIQFKAYRDGVNKHL